MRESHPYRKVSERKNAACNLSVTSLKSTCHCFIVIHNWDELVCRLVCFSGLKRFFLPPLLVTCPSIPHTECRASSTLPSYFLYSLFSFVWFFFFSSRFSYSSAFPKIFPFPGASPVPCWISCGLHRFPAPPSPLYSSLELEAIPEYSMMAVHLFSRSLAYAWACQFP